MEKTLLTSRLVPRLRDKMQSPTVQTQVNDPESNEMRRTALSTSILSPFFFASCSITACPLVEYDNQESGTYAIHSGRMGGSNITIGLRQIFPRQTTRTRRCCDDSAIYREWFSKSVSVRGFGRNEWRDRIGPTWRWQCRGRPLVFRWPRGR